MLETTSKRVLTGALLGALSLTAVPLTQALAPSIQDGPRTGLVPIDPPAGAEDLAAPQGAAFDAELWSARLTDADLDRREQAFEEAARAVRRSPAGREWLQETARGTDELAWTARLLLRELDRGGRGGQAFGSPLLGDPFAVDPFGADPFGGFFGGRGGAFGRPSILDAFDGLLGAPGARGQSQTFQFRMGPDGIQIETSEGVDGDRRTEVYEADDLESLLRDHPELRDRFGLAPGEAPAIRTDILGVRVLPTDAGGPGPEGLLVAETVIGTVAHLLGVERGSVLLELNGTALREVADISEVLGARPEGGEIRLRWIDAKGVDTTRVWRPGGDDQVEDGERREL